ncbi:hypothetical protein [cyanobacterium endosymbiont of Rhopalodia gibberula]|uniref:hypothetical protein n=1 Tax=cyanobacterium endosymbiont of Rhopalodia gibberula TaxID=1763363 RepID=UPI000E649B48|nr:hypothetical protein [cyanobacterium endosymbiont of Rhopalodia gibberula]
MLIFVVVCNFLLTILNFYIAFRLWKVNRILVKITKISTKIERNTNYILEQVSVVIMSRQLQTYQIRQLYQELTWKLQKLQQSIQLINLGLYVWKRYF